MTVLDALILAGRLLLVAVFILAGVTKLLDRAGSQTALGDFGLPAAIVAPSAIALPLIEIAVALALLPTASARYGAIAAFVLLILFLAGIANSLARGRRPHCHCFGQLYSEPVGWQALTRNGLLAAVAAFVTLAGWGDAGPSLVAWLTPLSSFERAVVLGGALGLALLMLQSVLLVTLVRQNGRQPQHLTSLSTTPAPGAGSGAGLMNAVAVGLPIGAAAPPFMLPAVNGDALSLHALQADGKPVVLLFSDPDCGPCNALLPEIGRWQREMGDAMTLALISCGTADANRVKSSEHGVEHVLLQQDREVAAAYGVFGTPSAVLVRPDGTIGSALAQGSDEIRRLVVPSAADTAMQVGNLSPDFTLPDLDGTPVALNHYRGRPTLVLFWNPGCGYCQQMLGDLAAWEARPLTDRAQLLIISTGTAQENRAQGLRSTVVLDPDFSVSSRFGVQGTPSAALVDADGRLAAPLSVGAIKVLALAGQPETTRDASSALPGIQTLAGLRPLPVVALPPDAVPVQESCVREEFLEDGGAVLHNGCYRQTLTLNATAALVWACCDGEHDIAGIIAEVQDVFPDAPSVEQDVSAMLQSLRVHGMIADARA